MDFAHLNNLNYEKKNTFLFPLIVGDNVSATKTH